MRARDEGKKKGEEEGGSVLKIPSKGSFRGGPWPLNPAGHTGAELAQPPEVQGRDEKRPGVIPVASFIIPISSSHGGCGGQRGRQGAGVLG